MTRRQRPFVAVAAAIGGGTLIVIGMVKQVPLPYLLGLALVLVAVFIAATSLTSRAGWLVVAAVATLAAGVAVAVPLALSTTARSDDGNVIDVFDLSGDEQIEGAFQRGDTIVVVSWPSSILWLVDASSNDFIAKLDSVGIVWSGQPPTVLVGGVSGAYRAFGSDGSVLWELGRGENAVYDFAAAFGDGTIAFQYCVTHRESQVRVYDSCEFVAVEPSGAERWRVPLPGNVETAFGGTSFDGAPSPIQYTDLPLQLPRLLSIRHYDGDVGTDDPIELILESTGERVELTTGSSHVAGDDFVAVLRHVGGSGCELEVLDRFGESLHVVPTACPDDEGRWQLDHQGDNVVVAPADGQLTVVNARAGTVVRYESESSGFLRHNVTSAGVIEWSDGGWRFVTNTDGSGPDVPRGDWSVGSTSVGTVAVTRPVPSVNPFVSSEAREVLVVDLDTGERCATFRFTGGPPDIAALPNCRALVFVPGTDAVYLIGPP